MKPTWVLTDAAEWTNDTAPGYRINGVHGGDHSGYIVYHRDRRVAAVVKFAEAVEAVATDIVCQSGQVTLWIATHPIDIEYAESLGIIDGLDVAWLPVEELELIDQILSQAIASGEYDYIIVD